MSLNKLPEAIEEPDLQALIDNEIPERKRIDYKQAKLGDRRDDKKEFLADVSSFANASGGYLIFGMKEEAGVAVELCGLQDINPDQEILRLENIIRDGLEPRVLGVSTNAVPLANSKYAIVIHIPRSWTPPHVVNFRKHWRFYSRNSAGKYPLDVSEVKTAFALSETVADRIRRFRTERLGNIVAGETPVALKDGAKVVLHIVPIGAFDPTVVFDLSSLDWTQMDPLRRRGLNPRHNFDGLLTYSLASRLPYLATTYLQVFRNGVIEAVETTLLDSTDDNGIPIIPSIEYEQELLTGIPKFLSIQKQLGVLPPLFVMLSLMGVRGYIMGYNHDGEKVRIDRNDLIIPEIMVEDFDDAINNIDVVMRPMFDVVWNATGWSHSRNYDDKGKWFLRR